MKKAIIIYQSKKGTTQKLGGEIKKVLESKGIQTGFVSLGEYSNPDLSPFDYIFLGCWTKGLMVVAQKPDKPWKEFVKRLDFPEGALVGLFTTYKIATGKMFPRMRKGLPQKNQSTFLEIKSRDGHLTKEQTGLIGKKVS